MDLKELRKALPWGFGVQASKDLGISRAYLSNMLHGHSKMRDEVLEYLIDVAEQYRAYKLKLTKKIERL